MFKKIASVSLLLLVFVSAVLVNPVYARSFNDYESAAFLAKIPEVKIETNLIATHAGNKDAIDYYVNMLNKYWTRNDTMVLRERNSGLADLITSTINDTIVNARAGNGDAAYSDYYSIAGYMEQAGEVRVDFPQSTNTTVQALSIVNVLKDSLGRYSDAIGSPVDLSIFPTDASTMRGINGATPGTQKIVNEYALENSKALTHESLNMFGLLIDKAPPGSKIYNDKLINSITKYTSDLNSAADPNVIISDVYMNIYPNFVDGYGISLQSIPEFPFPALIVASMIAGVIIISSRFY